MLSVRRTPVVVGIICVCLLAGASADGATLKVWAADSMTKVFRDTPPAGPGSVMLRAAQNEYVCGQIAIRSDVNIGKLTVAVTPLVHSSGDERIDGITWNFVGYVPVKHNTKHSEATILRKAPFDAPDPLLPVEALSVKRNITQPVWFAVRVPEAARPGHYITLIRVQADGMAVSIPLELTVDPFALPSERHLLVSNWFSANNIAGAHNVGLWSDEFWAVLARYAQNMAEHRQNVVIVSWRDIGVTREPDGRFTYDYTRFDRFIETFEKAGAADRIEIWHVAGFGPGGWSGTQIVLREVSATDRATGMLVSLPGKQALGPLLTDLERHLKETNRLDRAMIHVADEASINNIDSWRVASEFVHKAAPGIRRIDAIETTDYTGSLEVWVPKLSHLDRWSEAYDARRRDGEFWYYISSHPYGDAYPNRFLDYPLARVRVLHWINWSQDLRGYLHWGLTFWGSDPFGPPRLNLPPGDTHVLYPGNGGPLSSIRWDVQRDSIEDFEYLYLLAARTVATKQKLGPAAANFSDRRRSDELCRRIVRDIADTEKEAAKIKIVRNAIADEIIALGQSPLLLVETQPREGTVLIEGPILVEVRGVVEKGAKVTINGRPAAVRPDGYFAIVTSSVTKTGEIRVEAELNGVKKTIVRSFRIR